MPAPVLRHYIATSGATVNAYVVAGVAVPAGRALVISKITVASVHTASQFFRLLAAPTDNTDPAFALVWDMTLAPGQVYTESGIVLLAGQAIHIATNTGAAGTVRVNVFGEEVDN